MSFPRTQQRATATGVESRFRNLSSTSPGVPPPPKVCDDKSVKNKRYSQKFTLPFITDPICYIFRKQSTAEIQQVHECNQGGLWS